MTLEFIALFGFSPRLTLSLLLIVHGSGDGVPSPYARDGSLYTLTADCVPALKERSFRRVYFRIIPGSLFWDPDEWRDSYVDEEPWTLLLNDNSPLPSWIL